jgi:hypothetical protein
VPVFVGNNGRAVADDVIGGFGIHSIDSPFISTLIGAGTDIEKCVDGSSNTGACVGVVICPGCGSFLFANGCLMGAGVGGGFSVVTGLTSVCGGVDLGGVGSNSGTCAEDVGFRCGGAGVASGVGIAVA